MFSMMSKRGFSRNLTGPWNFVAGKRCIPSEKTGMRKVSEPATGNILCEVEITGRGGVNEAVAAALRSFDSWKELSPRQRGKFLLSAGKSIRENLEDIAVLEVKDTGKPIWEARVDIESCADALEFFGGIAPSITGEHVPLPGNSFAYVTREPFGVVAGVGAWNFPLQTCVWKVAPALMCGNTFVYKPSQFTPVTAVVLGEILRDSGVPDGVYNVVQGEGETGALLCGHPDVKKLSFTGSVPTGVKVMKAGAESIKAVTLELGGKSPMIVFPDANIEDAVKGAMMANFLSQGQVCSNGTRVFVHKDVMNEFRDLLIQKTTRLKIGDPFDEEVTVGATIHEEHARKVLSYVEEAKQQGAEVLCGGERVPLSGSLSGGWYLSPCVLAAVKPHMKVCKEEVFGSVLSLMEFEDEADVIKQANDTEFGLAGAVFTKDIQRGHRVARAIEAGTVWINTYNLYPPEVPFGGMKASGIGRENGSWVADHFSQTKTIYVEMGRVDAGPLFK